MNLHDIRSSYTSDGYNILDASSKACQDILLLKIAKSTLAKHVSIKGGVIIQHISKDKRRATRDFDLDFIRYSLDDSAIRTFIETLNEVDDGVKINITMPIEELRHQEYHGKRVIIELTDRYNNTIGTRLDIGVHSRLDIDQEEYCFGLDSIGENVLLLMNTREQMFAEKLVSLLKLGRFSTRYKDLFDFYYFITSDKLDKGRLTKCFTEYILNADGMKEASVSDIYKRLLSIFKNRAYLKKADTARNNWLEIPISIVTERILEYIEELNS